MKKNRLLISTLVLLALLALQYVTQPANESTAQTVPSSEVSSDEPITAQSSGGEDLPTVPKGIDYSLPALRKGSGEQILHRTAMTVSFNKEWLIPNWVAYLLLNDDMDGNAQRERDFSEDMEVEARYRVNTHDYSRSGYDRGHMAPAADFSGDPDAKRETFLMTNICPQNHELNARSWNDLEQRTRSWARREGGVYVVVGPIVNSKHPQTIGRDHKVVVPDAFFRCILSLKEGSEKAIGFIYKNVSDPQEMTQTCCTVDEVEAITGLDFFSAVPKKLQDKLEGSYNLREWNK